MGRGAFLRPAGCPRDENGSERAAAAASYHAGAGEKFHLRVGHGRSRRRQRYRGHGQAGAGFRSARPERVMNADRHAEAPISALRASAYIIPTDKPEADGTIAWNSTTLVLVEAEGGGETGLGYTYASGSAAHLAREKLAEIVE